MWYDDHSNLWLCASVMREIDGAFDVLYFLEKPWKWEAEWRAIARHEGKSVQEIAKVLTCVKCTEIIVGTSYGPDPTCGGCAAQRCDR